MTEKPFVFISYKSEEKREASAVRAILENNGVRVWMAPESIILGESYEDAIASAIENCDCVVFMQSESSMNSSWIKDELRAARDYGKPIVPVKLDDAPLKGGLHIRLGGFQSIRAYDFSADSEEMKQVVGAVKRAIGLVDVENSPVTPEAKAKPDLPENKTAKNTVTDAPETDFIYKMGGDYVAITKYTGLGGDVVIPAKIKGRKVTEIRAEAFATRREVRSVVIPDSVTGIEKNAFYNCDGIVRLTLGKGIKSIGENAFYGCRNIKEVNFMGGVKDWCCIMIANLGATPLNKSAEFFIGGKRADGVQIPEGVTEIANYVFAGAKGLRGVTLPESLKSIGYSAFAESGLIEVKLPSNITSVDMYAFSGCKNLRKINLPKKLKSVGNYAFLECESLTVHVETAKAPSSWDSGWNTSDCPVVYKSKG